MDDSISSDSLILFISNCNILTVAKIHKKPPARIKQSNEIKNVAIAVSSTLPSSLPIAFARIAIRYLNAVNKKDA